jgi:hypothetical protein
MPLLNIINPAVDLFAEFVDIGAIRDQLFDHDQRCRVVMLNNISI